MLQSFIQSAVLLASLSNAFTLPYVAPPLDVMDAEGFPAQPSPLLASVPNGGAVDRTGWVYKSDSAQANHGIYNTMDGNSNTYWHSMYSPTLHYLPHTITIDTKAVRNIDGITYRPRQDGSKNGNIGQHKIYTSTDGTNWGNPIAYGTWFDDQTSKSAMWETKPARYVMIQAITEAGNRGQWSSASEFYVYVAGSYTAPVKGLGSWGPTINFPLVPCAAAVEPDTGNVLTWSSYTSATFSNGPGGKTLTSVYNFNSKVVSDRLVTNTQHDMFCPGISFSATGIVVITGGNSAPKTSLYNGGADSWAPGSNMYTGRGYQSQVTMGNGNIFTIGGSWSGGQGGKNGEYYIPRTNTWVRSPNALVSRMLTGDARKSGLVTGLKFSSTNLFHRRRFPC
jgi:galactose oxidase